MALIGPWAVTWLNVAQGGSDYAAAPGLHQVPWGRCARPSAFVRAPWSIRRHAEICGGPAQSLPFGH
ncbi:MAG: hypothetical protein ACK5TQ_11820 [Acetobacteraceae bacterium]